MDDTTLKLAIGALFHDIGKFKQRANLEEDKGKTHIEIGYQWLRTQYDESLIIAGAQYHHGALPESWEDNFNMIFYEADNCVSPERTAKYDPKFDIDQSWHLEIELTNIFSHIYNHISDLSLKKPPLSYHHLGALGGWNAPRGEKRKNSSEDYRDLWTKFESDFDVIKKANNHYNINILLLLMEKFTSCIPAISLKASVHDQEIFFQGHSDISLFDHSKIVAATSVCLYQYYKDQYPALWQVNNLKEEITGEKSWSPDSCPFRLVGGHISGIQKFIYTISSKGALKSLKGRSFFLELLTNHVINRFLEQTDLSSCNIIFNGGGRFYLLVPNNSRVTEIIDNLERTTNDYLYTNFNGDLFQIIESTPFNKNSFKDTTSVWQELGTIIEKAKQRKWSDQIGKVLQGPSMPHDTCLTKNCEICGREDKPLAPLTKDNTEVFACEYCIEQFKLGSLLHAIGKKRSAIICQWDDDPKIEDCIRIGTLYYGFFPGQYLNDPLILKATGIYHINDWDLKNYCYPNSRPLFTGIYMPEDESTRDMEGMAQAGFGMNRISVLRMDVDNLGKIFSLGLSKNKRTLVSLASISRQLSLFFKYHINGILNGTKDYPGQLRLVERIEERKLSIVYSGGDDIFIIGHWLDVFEAAFDIEKAFYLFHQNNLMTISGGITFGYPHDPVYRLAEGAGAAEDLSKTRGKDSITLFDTHTFSWKEIPDLISVIKNLLELLTMQQDHMGTSKTSVPSTVFHRLLILCREHEDEKEKVWLMPKLAYLFGRFKPQEGIIGPWKELEKYIFSKRIDWCHFEVALLCTLMMMRKEKTK